MNLPGRLRLTTLGDVLGAVFREGATGVLELTEAHGVGAGRVHRIHVVGGLVGHVEAQVATARLGALLHRIGLLKDVAFRGLGERLAMEPGRRTGEILVGDGLVTPAAVVKALRIQRNERLERLFLLEDAQLAFRVALAPGADRSAPLGPGEFLIGRPRTRDRAGTSGSTTGRRHDPVRARALATLGLGDGADRISVQRAFRQLAAHLHPDRHPTANAAERADILRRFAEITAAYHTLVA